MFKPMPALITASLPSLLLTLGVLGSSAHAEFENNSYSYLGLGTETLTYSETTDDFGGQTFESKFRGSNLVQKSGGYTGVGERYGFFISTSSTLLANENKEKWKFEGVGVVQEDNMTLKRTAIDLLGVFHFQNGHFLTAGTHYNSVSFSRFDFDGTDLTEDLNDSLIANPDVQAQVQAELDLRLNAVNAARASGGSDCIRGTLDDSSCLGSFDGSNNQVVTLDEFWEIKKLKPEDTQGVVFEDMTSWSLIAGWGYDSFFVDQSLGMRYSMAARVGTAMYESILNTNNDRSLTRSFGGDWDVHLLAGVGYQFRKEIGVIATLELNGVFRQEIRENDNGQQIILPENTLWALSPQISAHWAF